VHHCPNTAEQHRANNQSSTANNQREKYCQHRSTGVGFVSAGKTDAIEDDLPNAND
jgi:hypothetical protein